VKSRAIFLDRDGVLNDVVLRAGRPHPPALAEGMVVLPGARESLARFKEAGYRTIVVTNQPDVATGVQSRDVVEEIHRRLALELSIDAFKVCFHVDAHECPCRKPKPGMLVEAALEWDLDLAGSWLIGDRWRDIGAGQAVQCRTVWIDRGYAERAPERPDFVVRSIREAARIVLDEDNARGSAQVLSP
jgi:D-glycero-D-manno-heptose 1,7-bisphosphate phosphatase